MRGLPKETTELRVLGIAIHHHQLIVLISNSKIAETHVQGRGLVGMEQHTAANLVWVGIRIVWACDGFLGSYCSFK